MLRLSLSLGVFDSPNASACSLDMQLYYENSTLNATHETGIHLGGPFNKPSARKRHDKPSPCYGTFSQPYVVIPSPHFPFDYRHIPVSSETPRSRDFTHQNLISGSLPRSSDKTDLLLTLVTCCSHCCLHSGRIGSHGAVRHFLVYCCCYRAYNTLTYHPSLGAISVDQRHKLLGFGSIHDDASKNFFISVFSVLLPVLTRSPRSARQLCPNFPTSTFLRLFYRIKLNAVKSRCSRYNDFQTVQIWHDV